MTTATAQIISALNELFIPMDAEVLAKSQEWATERKAALVAFKETTTREQRANQWQYYNTMYNICGGKTWFNVFNNNNAAGIAAFVTKNCAAIAAKRNATIARKLEKEGVTEVLSTTFTRTNDGFNGVFGVVTNNGNKTVSVDTIYAGGYNIQCLHLRVLTKIR